MVRKFESRPSSTSYRPCWLSNGRSIVGHTFVAFIADTSVKYLLFCKSAWVLTSYHGGIIISLQVLTRVLSPQVLTRVFTVLRLVSAFFYFLDMLNR